MEITKSVAFIEENGSDLEKARLRRVLSGVKPESNVVQSFTELQNDDGGFPYDMLPGNLSSIDNTLVALWWLDELGMIGSSTAEKAFGYLLTVQREDSGWDEDPAIAQYDLPPWISPGDLRTRLYLSAYAAYWLAAGGYRTHPAFQKALDFLLKHQDKEGKFYGYLHTTWIATSVFSMAGPQYAEVARKGLQALMNRSLSEWADSQIAWALDCLGKAGLSEEHPFIEGGLAELLQRQEPTGSWSSEDDEGHAVGATIAALKVLKHYGLLPDPKTLAFEIDAEIRALPVHNTPSERAIRRKYSRMLKDAAPGFVLRVARELIKVYGYRSLPYELIEAHQGAYQTLNRTALEDLGQGINSWWSVDSFSRTLSGSAWRDGLIADDVIHEWARSADRWWRRAALVSTVALNVRSQGGRGDTRRTLNVCRLLAADHDDMVTKAISWALRELVVHDPQSVHDFLIEFQDTLAARVKREVRNKLTTGLKSPRRKH